MALKETESLAIWTWSVSPSYKKQHKKPRNKELWEESHVLFTRCFIYLHPTILYNAQAPNAGSGDTNWRLLFDPFNW